MTSDRLKRALQGFIRATIPQVDYLAFYPAKVVSQAGDFSLDLIPDDTRLPSLQRVPLRLGLPGVTAKVAPGSYVLLFFERGDPAAPAAALWQSSSLLELVITATTKITVNAPIIDLADASAPVLRVGDVVTVTTGLANGGGPVTGTLTLGPLAGAPSKVKA